jgi:hypothetical protein
MALGLNLKRNKIANNSGKRFGPISNASFKEGAPF